MRKKIIYRIAAAVIALSISAGIFYACNEVSSTLAPYSGTPAMSGIQIQSGSYSPKVTWLGGYVSVFAVNRGTNAALDTSLVWLVYASGDGIHYPVQFNKLPVGTQDLTTQYGGKKIDSLSEDNTYTFWVMKQSVWSQLSSQSNKIFNVDTLSKTPAFTINGDTVKISSMNYFQETLPVNLYININEVHTFGQLATLNVTETNVNNNPILTWSIIQSGVPDSMIAAVGIVEGQEYDPNNTVWEVWSVQDSAGTPIYGKNDLISSPIFMGENFPGTQVFAAYPANGLQRGHYYYVWIADKTWDGTTRLRFAKGYAYATIRVY